MRHRITDGLVVVIATVLLAASVAFALIQN